jgi:very-short-patch-repair endonuclease
MDLTLIAPGGVFATADAVRVGLDAQALRRLITQGQCVRLTTGWFALTDGDLPDARTLHRLTATAMGRQFRSRAAVSHHSRLLLAGLPTFAAPLETVHLTSVVAPTRTAQDGAVRLRSATVRRRGVVIHRPIGLRIPDPDRLPAHRPRCLPVPEALIQSGMLAGPEAFLVPADAAFRDRLVTRSDLERAVARFAGHPGIGPVRAALPLVDARHESPGETRAAHLLNRLGYDLEPQVELVAGGRRYRPDFRIRGTRVLIEFDGALKYAGEGSSALFAEKQREDALRRDGWIVVRLVWADLAQPALVRARVESALAAAA